MGIDTGEHLFPAFRQADTSNHVLPLARSRINARRKQERVLFS
jgi:hypothetical protein